MDQPRAVTSVQINGPALRAIRERSGISGQALARCVGADHSFLARVERGEKRGVGRPTFERIVEQLDVDPRAIMADPYVAQLTTPLRDQSGPTVIPFGCHNSTAA